MVWGIIRNWSHLAFRHAARRALILLLITIINPFGVVEWSEARGFDIWQRLYAPFYAGSGATPKDGVGHHAKGRDAITLLLTDRIWLDARDGDVANGHDSLELRDLIKGVLRAGMVVRPGAAEQPPDAIFVDLLLGNYAPENVSADDLLAQAEVNSRRCDVGAGEKPSPFGCMLAAIAEITNFEAWRSDDTCRISALARIRCIQQHGGIPIIIADSFDPAHPEVPRSKGAEALGRVAAITPARIDPARYRLAFPEQEADRDNNDKYEISAAGALYAAYCHTAKDRPGRDGQPDPRWALDPQRCKIDPAVAPHTVANRPAQAWRGQFTGWSGTFDAPLATIWAAGSPSDFTDHVDTLQGGTIGQKCLLADTSNLPLFSAVIRALFSGITFDMLPPCPYTNNITFEGLERSVQARRNAMVSHKLVIIGLDDPASGDVVRSPVTGQLPGAFAHAMALDNLIERGKDYAKPSHPVFGGALKLSNIDVQNWIATAIMMILTGYVVVWFEMRNAALNERWVLTGWEWIERLLAFPIVVIILAAIVFIGVVAFGYYPVSYNVVALSIVALWEVLAIIVVVLDPIRRRLAAHHAWFAFFFDRGPQLSLPVRDESVGGV